MDLKETDILGPGIANHWYYRAKAAALMRMLGGRTAKVILDVGAGSGYFSRHLLAHTEAAEAWCVDISYESDRDVLEDRKPMYFRRHLERCDADLVLLMDVLEHVEDDAELLGSYAGRVKRGARFIVSVPAFQFLWSEHDVYLEHKRRYTLLQLEDTVRRAGLKPLRGAYFFGMVLPIAVMTRFAGRVRHAAAAAPRSQLRVHSPLVNESLAAICKLELPVFPINRVAGLTAFCVAQS